MKIGILGKTGSGKSTVASYFKKNGYTVIDLDQLANDLPTKYPQILIEISEVFGLNYIENGKINRKKLGQLVFSSENELENLNNIFFYYIRQEVKKAVSETDNIVIEGVIIFEAKLNQYLDKIFYIYCDDSTKAIDRLQKRENTSPNLLKKRLIIQKKYEKDILRADYKIENCESLEMLYKKVEKIKKSWFIEK